VPKLGAICLAALQAFELPNCLNLYLTGPNVKQSAPPHTDKQDVFVFQTCGAKRWRVYEPPPPRRMPAADPLARGKGEDMLRPSELREPLVETVLTPGQILYVPAGFPHTTSTVDVGAEFANEASVHLTVGVDSHIWGLNLISSRQGALRRGALPDNVQCTQLDAGLYWDAMRVPSSVGFLRSASLRRAGAATSADAAAVAELVDLTKRVEPVRWAGVPPIELEALLDAPSVVLQLHEHAQRLVEIQRGMYAEAMADDGSPAVAGMPRVTLFRVKPHLDQLERAMESHLGWYGAAEAHSGTSSPPPAPPTALKGGFGARAPSARKPKGKGKKKKAR